MVTSLELSKALFSLLVSLNLYTEQHLHWNDETDISLKLVGEGLAVTHNSMVVPSHGSGHVKTPLNILYSLFTVQYRTLSSKINIKHTCAHVLHP